MQRSSTFCAGTVVFLLLLLLGSSPSSVLPRLAEVAAASNDGAAAALICTCRCCYQGGCNTMSNVSWVVQSCSECTTKSCRDYMVSPEVRAETARLFEGIQGESIWATGEDVVIDECKVISVLEAATCTSKMCKRTTTIKAECYNRDAPLVKYSIVSFVLITLVALVFGGIKNNIPAFQALNEKYFNY